MPNILDKFRETTVGSSGRIMDYTCKLNPSGDFSKIYDINAILLSWNNILITQKGSYDHDPEFGSKLYSFIFEPADEATREGIKEEIIRSISTYDTRALIQKVTVDFLRNRKGFVVSIIAKYYGKQSEITITFDENVYQNYI